MGARTINSGWIALAIGAIAMCSMAAFACGTQGDAAESSGIERSGIVVEGASGADSGAASSNVRATRSSSEVTTAATPNTAAYETEVDIATADGIYTLADIDAMPAFKKRKEFDIDGLTGATGAVYGFYGSDPYSRREVEVRVYPDHETALTVGAEFAEESTGPYAVLTSSVQRWDEGITQRRTCRANTRGSHHSGRCDAAKFGDYLLAGNIVVLCEGLDSETALRTCRAFVEELP